MVERDDIGSVMQDDDLLKNTLVYTIILGECSLENYEICLKCNGKVSSSYGELGSCNRCGMFQSMDSCKSEEAVQVIIKKQRWKSNA